MLRDDLQAEAANLGFSLLGVTTLDPPSHVDVYQRWVEQGSHAGMEYLSSPTALEKRANPSHIFPSARSLLCLALPYAHPSLAHAPGAGYGRVAAYAWGDDYHAVIPPKLHALVIALERLCGKPIQQRSYSDTGPLLERDLAQRAGLGWIGKNTCLIHPRRGSFFFLAELLIDLELEPDPPFKPDRCGSCQRCILACPTSCISTYRTIDARRCISYLTIENKGKIPLELRPQLGNWIFGCDICQVVCPWNKRAAQIIHEPAFNPRQGLTFPKLIGELRLTSEAFNLRFRGSPIQRARRRGYLRNVAVAIGNQPDPEYLPVLADVFCHESEPLVRAHAAWAVRQINTPSAARLVDSIRQSETNALVLEELMI